MSGVGIVCFAASYGIVFLLEVSRFFFRSPIRGVFSVLGTFAGFVAHTAFLFYHVGAINNAASFFFFTAWGLVFVCLYLQIFHPKIPFGLVLLPIALLLIGCGAFTPASTSTFSGDQHAFSFFLKRVHTISFLLATLSVSVGFVVGLMYLVQDRRLRRKSITETQLKLPTLEWSRTACRHAIGASVVFLGLCIFPGVLLLPKSGTNIGDPLVWGTLLLFGFLLLFSGVLSFRFHRQEGRRVAVLTLVAFLFLIAILLFGVFFGNAHWKKSASNWQPEAKGTPVATGLFHRVDRTNRALRRSTDFASGCHGNTEVRR